MTSQKFSNHEPKCCFDCSLFSRRVCPFALVSKKGDFTPMKRRVFTFLCGPMNWRGPKNPCKEGFRGEREIRLLTKYFAALGIEIRRQYWEIDIRKGLELAVEAWNRKMVMLLIGVITVVNGFSKISFLIKFSAKYTMQTEWITTYLLLWRFFNEF